jgi:SAM-dependent methyltransferase
VVRDSVQRSTSRPTPTSGVRVPGATCTPTTERAEVNVWEGRSYQIGGAPVGAQSPMRHLIPSGTSRSQSRVHGRNRPHDIASAKDAMLRSASFTSLRGKALDENMIPPHNFSGLRGVLKKIVHNTYGSRFIRKYLTSSFDSGLFAIGECNHYFFPARFVTLDFGGADFTVRLDENLRLPFADSSQEIAYASHVLEHLQEPALEWVLREVHRVLKPGRGFRIEVPDSEILMRAYADRDEEVLFYFREGRRELVDRLGLEEKYLEDHLTVVGEMASYIDRARNSGHIPVYVTAAEYEAHAEDGIEAINKLAQSKLSNDQRETGGHNNALYFAKLEDALLLAGFSRVDQADYGKTIVPKLKLGRSIGRIWNRIPEKGHRRFYSLYVDAVK